MALRVAWSLAERNVFRLMPAPGQPPVSYGELRHRRLAEFPALSDPTAARRTLKRVDKELCDGLPNLVRRHVVRRTRDGRYSVDPLPALEELLDRLTEANEDVLRVIAFAPPPPASGPFSAPASAEALRALDVDILALTRDGWAAVRDKILSTVARGDSLFRGVPGRERPLRSGVKRRDYEPMIAGLKQGTAGAAQVEPFGRARARRGSGLRARAAVSGRLP